MNELDQQLRERAKLLADAKATLDLSAEANNGTATDEAIATANKMVADADAIHKNVLEAKRRADAQAELNRKIEAQKEVVLEGIGRRTSPSGFITLNESRAGIPQNKYPKLKFGKITLDPAKFDSRAFNGIKRRFEPDYAEAFQEYLLNGPGATFKWDVAAEGGIFVPPEFRMQMIKDLDEIFYFRQLATILPPVERRVDFPRRTVRERRLIKGQVWTASGTDGKLGTASWEPHCFTGEVNVNKQLMAMGAGAVEQYVRDEIVYDTAAVQEDLFLNGNGDQEPFGIFKANDNGLPTSADVSEGTLNFDAFVNFRQALRDVYLRSPSIRVIAHRTFQTMLMKIKGTSNDHPLFQPSLTADVPDRFLGVPMLFSEFAPTVAASPSSGAYLAVIGDLKQYWIAEGMNDTIERHDLETRSNLTSFLYRTWFDGNVAKPEAFKRLKKS